MTCVFLRRTQGRTPKDKRVVKDPDTQADVWWGGSSPNFPMEEHEFLINRQRTVDFLNFVEQARPTTPAGSHAQMLHLGAQRMPAKLLPTGKGLCSLTIDPCELMLLHPTRQARAARAHPHPAQLWGI